VFASPPDEAALPHSPDPADLRAQAAELRWMAMEAAPELAAIYRAASIRCIELADALQDLQDRLLAIDSTSHAFAGSHPGGRRDRREYR
jgi:hypothetical protein